MSSIKTTQLDGDVSVGRNVAIGGRATVAGSMTVGHNFKVDGWLEAVNVRDVNKGVFLSLARLREAYPNPRDGWFAGVGSSTPFAAYIGKDGDWVATGGTVDVVVDLDEWNSQVSELRTGLTELTTQAGALETDLERKISANATAIAANKTTAHTELMEQIEATHTYIRSLDTRETQDKAELEGKIDDNTTAIANNTTAIGQLRTDVMTEVADSIDELNQRVQLLKDGGDTPKEENADTLVTRKGSCLYLKTSGDITTNGHSSFSLWIITNTQDYEALLARIVYQRADAPYGTATVLLCFHVTDDFVFDENAGYVQSGNGYIYYPAHAVSSKVSGDSSYNKYFYLTEGGTSATTPSKVAIPKGVDKIYVCSCCPTTSTLPEVQLYWTEYTTGLPEEVNDLKGDVDDLKESISTIIAKDSDNLSIIDDCVLDIPTIATALSSYINSNGSVVGHNSFTRYSITNKGYTRIRVYVGLNDVLEKGMVPIALYDENDTFLAEQSTPALYTNTAMAWYEIEVPSNVNRICISHRKTAGTSQAYAYGVMNVAFSNAKDITTANNKISSLKSSISANARVVGYDSYYNRRAGMVSENRSYNSTVFSPFIKQPEPTGKRVRAKCVIPNFCYATQGGAIYNRLFVTASASGNVTFADMATCRKLQYSSGMIKEDAHNNGAFFSNYFYDENDTYPIIYFSDWDSTGTTYPMLNGYRIIYKDGEYSMALVNRIQLPAFSDVGVSGSCDSYMYDGKLYVLHTGIDTDKKTINYYNMPEFTPDGISVIEASDLLGSFSFDDPGTVQSGFVKDGILYCCYYYGIFAVNLISQQFLGKLHLKEVIPYEMETCFMYDGDLFVLAINRDSARIVSGISSQGEIFYVELLEE